MREYPMTDIEKYDRDVYVNNVYKKDAVWCAETSIVDLYDDLRERRSHRTDVLFEYDDMFNADSDEVDTRAYEDAMEYETEDF